MADGNMGTLSMAFNIVDKSSGTLNTIRKALDDMIKRGDQSVKKFDDLKKSINNLNVEGKLSKTGAEKAIGDIDKILKAYKKLSGEMATMSKLDPKFDLSKFRRGLDEAANMLLSFYKKNGHVNTQAILGTYGKGSLDSTWKSTTSGIKDMMASLSTELSREVNSIVRENKKLERAAEKAAEAMARAAEKEEAAAKKSRESQIKMLQLYIDKYNNLIKNIQSRKTTSPEIDSTKFDNTISRMKAEIRGLLDMLTLLRSTSAAETSNFVSRMQNGDSRAIGMAKQLAMTEMGTSYFPTSVFNNKQIELDRAYQRYNDSFRSSKDYAQQIKEQYKDDKERGRQILQLTSYIEQLTRKSQEASKVKFFDGTDTSKFDEARLKILNLISTFEQYKRSIEGGGKLYDSYALRFQRNQAQAFYGTQKSLATSESNQLRDLYNLNVNGTGLDKTIDTIERKMADIAAISYQVGIRPEVLGELTDMHKRLSDIRDTYKMIQSDSSMLGNKMSMKQQAVETSVAMRDAGDAIKRAKADVSDYNSSLKNAEEAEKAAARANQQYAKQMDDWGVKLVKIRELQDKLKDRQREAWKLGIDTSGISVKLRELNAFFDEYKRLLTSTSKKDVLGGVTGSLDSKAAMAQLKHEVNELIGVQRRQETAAKKAAKEQETDAKKAAEGIERQRRSVERLTSEYRRLSDASKNANNTMSSLKNTLMQFAPIYGLQQIVMSVIEVGGEIEKQHIAMQSILGDLHNANELFGEIKSLALQSPFTFSELNKDVKQLAAYGVEYEDLYDTTKRIADISSGLGVSFERLALAYGQVKSRSWLDGKELRQFAYAGVPLLKNLAEMYSKARGQNVSTGEVRKMVSNREVSFEDVQKVLWEMTDAGGKFYNMQEVLSETLLGRYNKLKDAWEIMLSGFAKGDSIVGGTMKAVLNAITSIVLALNSAAPAVAAFFSGFALNRLGLIGKVGKNNDVVNNVRQNQLAAAARIKQERAEAKKAGITTKRPAIENKILAANNNISAAYVRQQVLAGNINKQELKRLWIMKQITTEHYKYLSKKMGWATSLTRGTAQAGLAIKSIGSGIKSIGTGIVNFFGGPVGIAISAVAAGLMYYYTKQKEYEDRIKNAANEAIDRYKQLHDFIISNPISFGRMNHQEIVAAIEAYKNELRDKAGDMFGMLYSDKGTSESGTLKTLKNALGAYEEAERLAEKFSYIFEDAGNGVGKLLNESMLHNAEEYSKSAEKINSAFTSILNNNNWDAVRGFMKELKESNGNDKKILGGKIENAINDGKTLVEVLKIIRDNGSFLWNHDVKDKANPFYGLKDEWENMSFQQDDYGMIGAGLGSQIKEFVQKANDDIRRQGIDVTSQTGILMFNSMMKHWFSANEVPKYAQDFFSVTAEAMLYGSEENARKFADNMGNILPSQVQQIGEIAMAKLDETVKDQLRNNLPLGEVSRKKLQEALEEAYNEWTLRLPSFIDKMQFDLNKHKLFMMIEYQIGGDNSLNDYQNWALNKANDVFGMKQMEGVKSNVREYLKDLFKDGKSLQDAQKSNDELIKTAKTELERLKERKASQTLIDDQIKIIEKGEDARKVIGSAPDKEKKKRTKTPKDKQLEELIREARLVEKLIELYKKYKTIYGDIKARTLVDEKAKELGLEEYAFGNPIETQQKLADKFEKLYKNSPEVFKERRESEWKNRSEKVEEQQYQKEHDNVQSLVKAYTELNDKLKTQYDLREKIQKKYGSEYANTIAGSASVFTDELGRRNITLGESYKKKLEDDIRKYVSKHNNEAENGREVITFDVALNGSEDDLNNWFGKDSEAYKAIHELRTEIERLNQASKDAVLSQLDEIKSNSRKFYEAISEYNDTEKTILNGRDRSELSEPELQALDIAKSKRDEAMLKTSSSYQTFFNNVYSLTEQELDIIVSKIEENLKEQLRLGRITQEEYNKKTAEIRDKKKSYNYDTRNLFGGSSKWSQFFGGGLENVIEQLKKKVEDGKATDKDKEDLESLTNLKNGLNTISDVIKIATGVFEGLTDATKSLSDMFYAIGDKSKGDTFSDISDAISAGSSVLTPVNDLIGAVENGDVANIVSNAISAPVKMFTGPISGFAKLHDKKLQRQIETLERQNKLVDNMSTLLKKNFETTIAKMYSDDNDSYYTKEKEFMEQKLKNYKEMLAIEEDKKDSDESKLDEYKQSISELELEIKEYSKTLAEELYGIDFASYAKSISESLFNAWASGSDGVKAYRDTVEDVMKNVAKTVVEQKIIGAAFEKLINPWLEQFNANGGVMNESLYNGLYDIFGAMEDKTNEAFTFLDSWEDISNRYGYTNKDEKTSAMSSTISSMTEDTADLLCSYINAVRADVSINRTYLQSIAESFPGMKSDINLGLKELQGIKGTLDLMEVNISNMYDLFNEMSLGKKSMYVKMKVS